MIQNGADLRYFVEVANTLNVTRASERLGITQPSLSLALRRLEDSLGTRLLIRRKTGVHLTPAGVRVAAQSRVLLSEWGRLKAAAHQSETEITGRFTLGCHGSVALYSLPGFLPDLLRKHPGLEFHLVHGLSRQVTEEVISWRADLGIVVNPIRHPDLVIRVLAEDDIAFWHAPHADKSTLICDPELLQTQAILAKAGGPKSPFTRTISSSNLEVIASLTAAGCGLGILPARVAARSEVKLTRWGKLSYRDRICLVYRSDAPKTRAFREITESIEKAETWKRPT